MSNRQESLQRQVSLMQQRLQQSQEDLKKLSLGDVPAQLKTTKQERDVLLEFIEGKFAFELPEMVHICVHMGAMFLIFTGARCGQETCRKALY